MVSSLFISLDFNCNEKIDNIFNSKVNKYKFPFIKKNLYHIAMKNQLEIWDGFYEKKIITDSNNICQAKL